MGERLGRLAAGPCASSRSPRAPSKGDKRPGGATGLVCRCGSPVAQALAQSCGRGKEVPPARLVDRVNLLRDTDGVAQIRIAWRGGQVTETRIRVPVNSLRYTEAEKHVTERIRQLSEDGQHIAQIAASLNSEGLVPCRGGSFTKQIVIKFKKRFHIVSARQKIRRGDLPRIYTATELADILKIDRSWLYRRIADRSIRIRKIRPTVAISSLAPSAASASSNASGKEPSHMSRSQRGTRMVEVKRIF